MNLDRVVFNVNGAHIEEAKKAVKNLPEGVLGHHQRITLERWEPSEREKETFVLKTQGKLYLLELPEGLSNIIIYRRNDSPSKNENGRVSFDCGDYHYLIPALED